MQGREGTAGESRFTIWEIHPVYGIDVCKFDTTAEYKAGDHKAWTPLDEWEEPAND